MNKSKIWLIFSFILAFIAFCAVVSFFVLLFLKEEIIKWIGALILAVLLLITNVIDIVGYFKKKNK